MAHESWMSAGESRRTCQMMSYVRGVADQRLRCDRYVMARVSLPSTC
jgi:hypothetical protein